jgi:hypothetical protein
MPVVTPVPDCPTHHTASDLTATKGSAPNNTIKEAPLLDAEHINKTQAEKAGRLTLYIWHAFYIFTWVDAFNTAHYTAWLY